VNDDMLNNQIMDATEAKDDELAHNTAKGFFDFAAEIHTIRTWSTN